MTTKSLLEIALDKKEEVTMRERAISIISAAARIKGDQQLLKETIKTLLKLYFEDTNLSASVKETLNNFENRYHRTILQEIREYQKQTENRSRAEELLKELIQLWMPTDLTRSLHSPQSLNE